MCIQLLSSIAGAGGDGGSGGGDIGAPPCSPAKGQAVLQGPLPDPQFNPNATLSTIPGTNSDVGVDAFDANLLAGLFDEGEAGTSGGNNNNGGTATEVDYVKSVDAVAGVCGFRNFANTCYMNSGLQCLFATPTVVKYFTDGNSTCSQNNSDLKDDQVDNKLSPLSANNTAPSISERFGPLVKDVWAGEYSTLKPSGFKSTLELNHPQFKGSVQHDCQEFLALLLGSLHEELKAKSRSNGGRGKYNKANSSSYGGCGTSMELHTSHSTEREMQHVASITSPSSIGPPNGLSSTFTPSEAVSGAAASGAAAVAGLRANQRMLGHKGNRVVQLMTGDGSHALVADGTESRGSYSPKSYDSASSHSLDDKVTLSNIRQQPIPNEVKTAGAASGGNGGGGGSASFEDEADADVEDVGEEEGIEDADEGNDDTLVDCTSSPSGGVDGQLTSNLVFPEELKRTTSNTVVHVHQPSSRSIANTTGGASMSEGTCNNRADLGFLTKENKTLNVNVLAPDFDRKTIPNNKINFESEKFHHDPTAINQRNSLQTISKSEKIDNNLDNKGKNGRTDECDKNDEAALINDFHAIKRMRLDSSEKNIQHELDRAASAAHDNGGMEEDHIGDEPDISGNPSVVDPSVSGGHALVGHEVDAHLVVDDEVSRDTTDTDAVNAMCNSSGAGGGGTPPCSSSGSGSSSDKLKEAVEADRCWEKYLALNDTVVARTFQVNHPYLRIKWPKLQLRTISGWIGV